MKIVAGLGCVDDYISLAEAGADEVFCGYVPYEWNEKYGSLFPLNRREVLYYNIQINSFEDMKILSKMVQVYKVPVNITFNYLYYLEEQYEMIEGIIKDLMSIGFNDFIVADLALLLYLNEKNIKCSIHLSGECAELNRLSIEFFNKFHISRYIFHRKNTIEDMEACINNNQLKNLEYEAFILNEKCHYTGAFCSSLHCDEMIHLCKMPYDIAKVSEQANSFEEVNRKIKQYYKQFDENKDEETLEENQYYIQNEHYEDGEGETGSSYILGETGCGLCALKELKMAGVTHLKVVGRGNSVDNMKRDVENLRKAIDMLEEIEDNTYEISVKDRLFKGKCSGQCYYY